MLKLITWHNRFSENKNDALQTLLPRHRDSKSKKLRERDSKTKKQRRRDSGTKTPQHQETETTKAKQRDSKAFSQRTKSHNIKIPRLRNHDIEIPRLKSYNIKFLWNFDPYDSWYVLVVENTERNLLNCSNFANQRTVLFDELQNIGTNYGRLDSCTLSRMLLFGNLKFSDNVNSSIIYAVIKFLESTNSFSGLFMIHNNLIFSTCFVFKVNLDFFFPGQCSWLYHQCLVCSIYCFLPLFIVYFSCFYKEKKQKFL